MKTAKAPAKEYTLHPQLAQAFAGFLEYTPAARLSRNLRKMMMTWLMDKHDTATYADDLLHDLDNLFELLDAAEIVNNNS